MVFATIISCTATYIVIVLVYLSHHHNCCSLSRSLHFRTDHYMHSFPFALLGILSCSPAYPAYYHNSLVPEAGSSFILFVNSKES